MIKDLHLTAFCLGISLLTSVHALTAEEQGTGEAAPFRPEAGKFPPLEKAYSYRGELILSLIHI